MRKIITFYFILLNFAFFYSQVVISPIVGAKTRSEVVLNLKGQLQIETINKASSPETVTGSILVVEGNTVKSVKADDVVNNFSGKSVSYLKGKGDPEGIGLVTLVGAVRKIGFNDVEFDMGNDYDKDNNEFIAPKDGVYNVYAQIQGESLLSVGGVFGLVIYTVPVIISNVESKEYGDPVVVAQTSNVITGLGTVANRVCSSLVKLSKYDKLYFAVMAKPTLISELTGDPAVSFFTISQVK